MSLTAVLYQRDHQSSWASYRFATSLTLGTHALHSGRLFDWRMAQPPCMPSRRANATILTAVLILVVWMSFHRREIVDGQRGRLRHALSHLHSTQPSSGSPNGPSRPSTSLPPGYSTPVPEDFSAGNSTLGVSQKAPLLSHATTDSLHSLPRSSQ